jgi:putative glycosyltransferase
MKLSVVTTLYRSAGTIEAFHHRAVAAAEALADEVEIVMVNDGSPDDSLAVALALMQRDPRVVVVDLARNFGHHKAMMTGLAHATGELVFLIDSDLEEPPELLAEFHATMLREDCDVAYGVQRARRGGMVERVTGELFFRLTEMLSDHTIPRNVVTARLMRRDYVRALLRYRDREFVIAHLWAITGFRQVAMPIEKLSLSPTTYSLRRRIEMAVKHVTTTSTKLLYFFLYSGLVICLLSVLVTLFYLVRYFTSGIGVDGFTSLIVSVWFFGGTTVLILGVLGIYIANILSETRRRPYVVVRRVHRAEARMGDRTEAREQGRAEARPDG